MLSMMYVCTAAASVTLVLFQSRGIVSRVSITIDVRLEKTLMDDD